MNLGLQIVGDFRELMIFLDLSFESLSEVLDAWSEFVNRHFVFAFEIQVNNRNVLVW